MAQTQSPTHDNSSVEAAEHAELPLTEHEQQPSLDTAKLTTFVQSIISGASLTERRGLEVHYRLPLVHANPRALTHLFTQLEEQKVSLGVMSYGISSCTMEEVFLVLCV